MPEFETFKLDCKTENLLQTSLDNNLKNSHTELVKSFSKINDLPDFHYCVFKPLIRNEFSRGVFTAYRMDKFQFGLFTVDYIIFFFTNSENMNKAYENVSNFQNKKLLVTLAAIEDWKMLNKLVVSNMLKNNS